MDDVQILMNRGGVVLARVRDAEGIWDASHGSQTGWRCSCREPGVCAHVSAVRELARPATKAVA